MAVEQPRRGGETPDALEQPRGQDEPTRQFPSGMITLTPAIGSASHPPGNVVPT
jgi:hypothetical protein